MADMERVNQLEPTPIIRRVEKDEAVHGRRPQADEKPDEEKEKKQQKKNRPLTEGHDELHPDIDDYA